MSTLDSFEVEVDDPEKGLYKLDLGHKEIPRKKKLKDWWQKHSEKIILAVGIILIAAISFEAGFLRGQKNQQEPVTVNQAACAPCPSELTNDEQAKNKPRVNNSTGSAENKNATAITTENNKCAFVASKNSDKYHLATCQWAEKIKAENKLCFSSSDEARKRGYQPAKCCIK